MADRPIFTAALDNTGIHIQSRLAGYQPKVISSLSSRVASVALILQHFDGIPKIFFIKRAVNARDPWSGQIAFPGGGQEEQDKDIVATACRETIEEVGILINEQMLIGRLDDLQGSSRGKQVDLTVSCFVFYLDTPQKTTHNMEVGESIWVSIGDLMDPRRVTQVQTDYSDSPYPAVRLEAGKVLWGLTYRFVERFLEIVS